MAKKIVLAGACRTAIGKMGGELSTVPAVDLGAAVIREAVKRAGLKPEQVDHVYMGNVISSRQVWDRILPGRLPSKQVFRLPARQLL